MIITRYSQNIVRTNPEEKMVFIFGPRQVKKTTLAKMLLEKEEDCYFNWDKRGRKGIVQNQWVLENRALRAQ